MKFYAQIIVEAEKPEDFEAAMATLIPTENMVIVKAHWPVPDNLFWLPRHKYCHICDRSTPDCECRAIKRKQNKARKLFDEITRLMIAHKESPLDNDTARWRTIWKLYREYQSLKVEH
jgi:hypothetical protein